MPQPASFSAIAFVSSLPEQVPAIEYTSTFCSLHRVSLESEHCWTQTKPCRFGSLELDAFSLQSGCCCYLAVFFNCLFCTLRLSPHEIYFRPFLCLHAPSSSCPIPFLACYLSTSSIKNYMTLQFFYRSLL